MNKYIYGLDLSLTSTGVAIYDLTENKFVHISHIDTTLMKPRLNRDLKALKLLHIANTLFDLKEQYPPSVVTVEAPYIAMRGGGLKGAGATESVYLVQGIAKYIFSDVPQHYFAPTSVKATIYHGKAEKEDLKRIIVESFPYTKQMFCDYQPKRPTKKLTSASHDESDAVSIILTYLITEGLLEWTKPDKPEKKSDVPDMGLPKPKKKPTHKKKPNKQIKLMAMIRGRNKK